MNDAEPDRVASAIEELYGLAPEEFVAARDERVAAARADGDRDAARAISRLRRPTQAAWLANLLARERAEQLDGLLALAEELSDAQRSLDGAVLRELSAQRHKLVAAMAREARRIAARDGHRVQDGTERDLRGILEAALADPDIAAEVRSGRLHRTVSYSGFGSETTGSTAWQPRPVARTGHPAPTGRAVSARGAAEAGPDQTAPDQPAGLDPEAEAEAKAAAAAERARRRRERAEADQDVAQAWAAARAARDRAQADRAGLAAAEQRHIEADNGVAELTAALEEARGQQRAAAEAERSAAAAARRSANAARAAAAELSRAEARLAALAAPP
ncbi:hypothetical protein [Pseudonocardia asaccharolytica]|uniref:Uncharacterized protein n=1 Tax=Pseudonocardia asaccharolytica DSM 44247 = NBRC 16224 TaxID=1123024 RepID=A0A511D5H9_9PSEU|nr:hypothetical protein [Pseudonocardia asaccharolytica]GEL20035.1 hypothetical protein PA7_38720 [Pseudonocardia asaccharolytica DSM 44247 = NBRC 16224]